METTQKKTQPPMTQKQVDAMNINEIQQDVMGIYFKLEEFKEYDTAGASLTKTLELMDAVSTIRTRILKGNSNN